MGKSFLFVISTRNNQVNKITNSLPLSLTFKGFSFQNQIMNNNKNNHYHVLSQINVLTVSKKLSNKHLHQHNIRDRPCKRVKGKSNSEGAAQRVFVVIRCCTCKWAIDVCLGPFVPVLSNYLSKIFIDLFLQPRIPHCFNLYSATKHFTLR